MAQTTLDPAGTLTAAPTERRLPQVWRLVPLAFYLLAFALIRGDLARAGAIGDLSLHLYFGAMLCYLGGMFFYFAFFAYRTEALRWLAIVLVVPGAALHLSSIITRGMADGHYPLANMYEYSSMLALVAVTVFLLMSVRWPVVSQAAGGVALFVVVALMGIGYGLYQSPEPLVPALQSYWLKIHVTSMMASSGILVSSFVFAALYLVKDRSASVKSWLNGSTIAARLPSLETLDRLTFRAILLGFPIWTFGTMAGAIWGEHAWGRWWGWDPKETWAAITWIVYAIYLHAHSLRAWRGRRTALIATAGFVSILVTLYAVNLWIVGLHSYARGAG